MFDIARNTISFDPLCFERVKMFNITEIKSEILLELKQDADICYRLG